MRCASPPLFLSYHWFLGALVGPLRRRLGPRAADRILKKSKKPNRGNVMHNRLPTIARVSLPTRPIRKHASRSGLSWKRTRLIWINFSNGERAIRHKGRFAQTPRSQRGAADRGQRGETASAIAEGVTRGKDAGQKKWPRAGGRRGQSKLRVDVNRGGRLRDNDKPQ